METKLILFSGLGGDSRLFRDISVPGVAIEKREHIDPVQNETLKEYSQRIRETQPISETDIVGGASFGGMIAAEIANQQRVAGLVLLGSCIHPERLPRSYRLLERLGALVPDFLLGARSFGPLVRWRFYPIDSESEKCMVQMAADCPTSQIRSFGKMVVTWPGIQRTPPKILSIHGDLDRIIPINCGEPGVVIQNAGHSFTLTHSRETNSAMKEFVRANSGYGRTAPNEAQ